MTIKQMTSDKIAYVELEKMHCFQPFLNDEYVEKLVEVTQEIGDEDGLMRFCLPSREKQSKNSVNAIFNPNTNTYFISNREFRF